MLAPVHDAGEAEVVTALDEAGGGHALHADGALLELVVVIGWTTAAAVCIVYIV